jgi:REP element-mobilizing transposase RayT
MSHTFSSLLTHVVFSTHRREPLISGDFRGEMHAYLGGIVRELRGSALMVGGTGDHVHMLVKLPCDVAIADCMRVVKTNSSRWVHGKWPERRDFAWQAGYGAFSVSESNRDRVVKYIRQQEEHHRKMTFEEELVSFLKKQGIEFDERYLWG